MNNDLDAADCCYESCALVADTAGRRCLCSADGGSREGVPAGRAWRDWWPPNLSISAAGTTVDRFRYGQVDVPGVWYSEWVQSIYPAIEAMPNEIA